MNREGKHRDWVREIVARWLRIFSTPLRRSFLVGGTVFAASLVADWISVYLTGRYKLGAYAGNIAVGILAGYVHYRVEYHKAMLGKIDRIRDMLIRGEFGTMDELETLVREIMNKYRSNS